MVAPRTDSSRSLSLATTYGEDAIFTNLGGESEYNTDTGSNPNLLAVKRVGMLL